MEVFDDAAKRQYQQRIQSIQKELAEAGAALDSNSMVKLQTEYDEILDHLSKALGKGGKKRELGSGVEKARSAVTWRIRSAIKRLGKSHSALGKHLAASIKTGVFCEYQPEYEVEWQL